MQLTFKVKLLALFSCCLIKSCYSFRFWWAKVTLNYVSVRSPHSHCGRFLYVFVFLKMWLHEKDPRVEGAAVFYIFISVKYLTITLSLFFHQPDLIQKILLWDPPQTGWQRLGSRGGWGKWIYKNSLFCLIVCVSFVPVVFISFHWLSANESAFTCLEKAFNLWQDNLRLVFTCAVCSTLSQWLRRREMKGSVWSGKLFFPSIFSELIWPQLYAINALLVVTLVFPTNRCRASFKISQLFYFHVSTYLQSPPPLLIYLAVYRCSTFPL